MPREPTDVSRGTCVQGSLFGPYTPLQKLDILADFGTKSYIVGSTNSLLLQQRDRYSDILINLDENTINITSSSLRRALALTAADRRWIDFIVQEVNDTWDESNPSRPKTMGYRGSEEFIRLQFEEYLLSLIASVKYHNCLEAPGNKGRVILPEIAGDPAVDYGLDWVEAWSRTENYRLWNAHTDSELFNIVEPQHPTAGSLTIEDVQRQFAERVQELHLDERFAQGKEVLGRNLAAGREKAASFFNKLYADMEAMRDAQRRRAEEAKVNGGGSSGGSLKRTNSGMSSTTVSSNSGGGGVDLAKAQQTMQVVGAKAGAYMSSWATWASEKRKTVGWGGGGGGGSGAASSTPTTSSSGGANISRISLTSGWGAGWGSGAKSRPPSVGSGTGMTERDSLVSSRPTPHSPGLPATTTFASMSSTSHGRPLSTATSSSQISSSSVPEASAAADTGGFRPLTQSSFSEAGSLSLLSAPASPVMSFKEAQRQAQQQQPPPQQDGETDHQKQEKKTESEVEIQKVGNKVVLVLDEPATKTTPETSVPASSEVARTTGSEKTEEAGVPSTLKE